MIKLYDLFDFVSGVSASSLDINEIKTDNTIALTRPSNTLSNVIVGYVDKDSINNENIVEKGNIMISTDGEGSHSYSYVLDFDFVPNSNVIGLRPKIDLTLEQKLFYALCITSNRYRYSYGRKPKGDRLKELLVPSLEELPRWVNEESEILKYYESLNVKQSWNEKNNVNVLHREVLDVSDWKEYKISELFRIEGAKGKDSRDLEDGVDIPYIGAKKEENGVMKYICKEGNENIISKGNCIVFIQLGQGSVGYANYMPCDFIGMNGKISCGYHKNLNEFNGVFLANILSMERPKYSFGRSWTGERLKETIIKLPSVEVNGKYEPNWKYMEQFVKNLPYSCGMEGKMRTKFAFCPNGDIEVIVENLFDKVENVELSIDSWKEFKLSDLFDIYKCKQKNKQVKKVSLITATSFNNGVKEYIETDVYENGNKITVTCNGACCDAFYQKYDFQSNGDVGVLSPKFEMTDDIALFICKIIEAEKFKYSYGRKYNLEKLNNTIIKLPELNGKPNYVWMSNFIKNLTYSCCLEGKIRTKFVFCLNEDKLVVKFEEFKVDWCEFKLSELFDISKGKRLTKQNQIEGNIPFITAGKENRGLTSFVGNDNMPLFSNSLTVDMFCNSFYYKESFTCDDNIIVLSNEKLNEFVGLFISCVINQDTYRYNYGRQYRLEDVKSHIIKLPSKKGEVDWYYMEQYIKLCNYSCS